MPEMVRDEFNAYKKSILQEHLYELLFKEAEPISTTSTAASFESLMDMPSLSFGEEECSGVDFEIQEFELRINELIGEVVCTLKIVQRSM